MWCLPLGGERRAGLIAIRMVGAEQVTLERAGTDDTFAGRPGDAGRPRRPVPGRGPGVQGRYVRGAGGTGRRGAMLTRPDLLLGSAGHGGRSGGGARSRPSCCWSPGSSVSPAGCRPGTRRGRCGRRWPSGSWGSACRCSRAGCFGPCTVPARSARAPRWRGCCFPAARLRPAVGARAASRRGGLRGAGPWPALAARRRGLGPHRGRALRGRAAPGRGRRSRDHSGDDGSRRGGGRGPSPGRVWPTGAGHGPGRRGSAGSPSRSACWRPVRRPGRRASSGSPSPAAGRSRSNSWPRRGWPGSPPRPCTRRTPPAATAPTVSRSRWPTPGAVWIPRARRQEQLHDARSAVAGVLGASRLLGAPTARPRDCPGQACSR